MESIERTSGTPAARVCVLAPLLAAGDGIFHDVAGIVATVRMRGMEVHVFAGRVMGDVGLPVRRLEEYEAYAHRPDTLTIYEHCIAWHAGERPFLDSAGPKVLRYHSVTPPMFFELYSSEWTHVAAAGRRQTGVFAASARIDGFLPTSAFTQRELVALGAPPARCRVLAPFHPIQTLWRQPLSRDVLARHLDGTPTVLFVGRVVPNKGHRHLLGVLAAYRHLFRRPLRLAVVGDLHDTMRPYRRRLDAIAQGLGVARDVLWTGKVDPAALATYYALADVFLVMSEHEGFCIPIVEAMAYGVPVIAHASAAVAETVGDAGILLDGLDYDAYAAAIELVRSRPDLRDRLIERQARWVAERFAPAALAGMLWDAIAPWLGTRPAAAPAASSGRP